MSAGNQDYIGIAGDQSTQGLGRLIGQYVNSPKLVGLLTGLYEMGQDLDGLFRRLSRITNPHDDVNYTTGGVFTANTLGSGQTTIDGIGPTDTTCVQLDIVGHLVGVARQLPNQNLMTNALYYKVITEKIARNHARGCTIPELVDQLATIFDPDDTGLDITVDEIGSMTVLVAIGREITANEASLFQLTTGVNMVKGSILPRPTGVCFATFWQEAGCFGFSASSDPGVALFAGALGFGPSNDPNAYGKWARGF